MDVNLEKAKGRKKEERVNGREPLRGAFWGGDVYRPHVDQAYYDINSLYPATLFSDMPVGVPTLVYEEMDDFIGYGEYDIVTPDNLHIPFLFHLQECSDSKGKDLIFPTGQWRGGWSF